MCRSGNINFPRLNASPTRVPQLNIPVNSGSGGNSSQHPPPYHQLPQQQQPHHHHPHHHHHQQQQQHPAPPAPGRMGRPEPYSPTERNNLNKLSDPAGLPHSASTRASTLPMRTSGGYTNPRTGGGGSPGDDQPWGTKDSRDSRDPRDTGGARNSRSLPRGSQGAPPSHRPSSRSPHLPRGSQRAAPDDRSNMAAGGRDLHNTSGSPVRAAGGRSRGGGVPVVPNGFKPKGRKPQEKYEMRGDNNAPQEDSDEDDDDWC
ncbi:voltage-dependent non-L-type calcium channel alpha-1 subunit isoform A [Elysia marginata]|uniref:Voltage-dependent non-L-type calcium channel alpha-1 subunit isoform A n=1 Tax=Elysia marginata TaxID=1093978 RepID=A0AAV4F6P3_9GAST|nr:voltage-dependent non-L-type calcium channel alpha-1 subunit isoform A [Elysia marginata]